MIKKTKPTFLRLFNRLLPLALPLQWLKRRATGDISRYFLFMSLRFRSVIYNFFIRNIYLRDSKMRERDDSFNPFIGKIGNLFPSLINSSGTKERFEREVTRSTEGKNMKSIKSKIWRGGTWNLFFRKVKNPDHRCRKSLLTPVSEYWDSRLLINSEYRKNIRRIRKRVT